MSDSFRILWIGSNLTPNIFAHKRSSVKLYTIKALAGHSQQNHKRLFVNINVYVDYHKRLCRLSKMVSTSVVLH